MRKHKLQMYKHGEWGWQDHCSSQSWDACGAKEWSQVNAALQLPSNRLCIHHWGSANKPGTDEYEAVATVTLAQIKLCSFVASRNVKKTLDDFSKSLELHIHDACFCLSWKVLLLEAACVSGPPTAQISSVFFMIGCSMSQLMRVL